MLSMTGVELIPTRVTNKVTGKWAIDAFRRYALIAIQKHTWPIRFTLVGDMTIWRVHLRQSLGLSLREG